MSLTNSKLCDSSVLLALLSFLDNRYKIKYNQVQGYKVVYKNRKQTGVSKTGGYIKKEMSYQFTGRFNLNLGGLF